MTKFPLRPYQQKAKDDVKASFAKGNKKVVLCAPTGSGKTVTFADMCIEVIRKAKSVMIIVDRKELLQQASNKLNDYGLLATLINPDYKGQKSNCYVASIDTLQNREKPEVDLIVIDEVHKGTFKKVHDWYPDNYIIGASATPISTRKYDLSQYFTDIIEPVTIGELIEQGYLAKPRSFGAKQDFSSVKTSGTDYDNKELFEHYNKSELYADVVGKFQQLAMGTKAIVFNVNVEHSKNTCQAFRDAGIDAYHIDANTPDLTRRLLLTLFKNGKFQVLCNCSILTTGYDEPTIETVIINRATKSLALFLQMCGRGSRVIEGVKESFNIIDMGSNIYRHGWWEDNREWKLEAPKARAKKMDTSPVKSCPECSYMMHPSVKVCPECSHEFPVKTKEQIKAEFIELTRSKLPESLRDKDPIDMNLSQLRKYQVIMGYKPQWVWIQMNLKKKKLARKRGAVKNKF